MSDEFWKTVGAACVAFFSGGTVVKVYSLWQRRRHDDREYITDTYRQLIEDEKFRVEEERRTSAALRRRVTAMEDSLEAFKDRLADAQLVNIHLKAQIVETCERCEQNCKLKQLPPSTGS